MPSSQLPRFYTEIVIITQIASNRVASVELIT